MKKRILLTITLLIFTFNSVTAQDCPNTLTGSSSIFAIQFNIGPIASTNPNDYPSTINILDSTGTSEITYIKGESFENGVDNFVEYDDPQPQPWEGKQIDINNFTVDFGFSAGDCKYVVSVLPVENYSLEANDISLFPNPISKNKPLNIRNLTNDKISVFIYDITGKMVINRNERNLKIDISSLNQGMYFVKIIGDNLTTTRKLVVTD